MSEKDADKTGSKERWQFARWKKVLAAGALLLIVVGAGLQATTLIGGDSGAESAGAGSSDLELARGSSGSGSSGSGSAKTSFAGNSLLPTSSSGASGSDDGGEPNSLPRIETQAEDEGGNWSPALMKLGFSFFVGLAIGYAVRAFLKVTLLFAGIVLLAVFGLNYFGLVQVDWSAMEGVWDSFIANVQDEAGHFKTFITGSLPSAGMAGLGLFTGFKRR